MSYISLETLIEARRYVDTNVRKADTFAGLVLFLLCVCKSERDGTYVKSDMRRFSEYADKAFSLSSDKSTYAESYWYALLTVDWTEQVKDSFLNGKKILLRELIYSLFWYETENEIREILKIIPENIINELFIDNIETEDFVNIDSINKQDLISHYKAQDNSITIKFDGSFIKKRAGDLSGAPFGQTLYAGKEIKKIISVYDFDFMKLYNLYDEEPKVQSNHRVLLSENFIRVFVYKLMQFLVTNDLDLTLFQYLVERKPTSNIYNIKFKDQRLSSIFKISDEPISENELKQGDILRFFTEPINVGTDLYYLSNQWTDSKDSPLDMQTLITIFNEIYDGYKIIKENGSYILIQTSQLEQKNLPYSITSLSKPFLLLAGISGTGKTRFIREQAKATGKLSDTYCLTSVRPDWHEPSDILGYISRLGRDGNAEYITTDVLQFIAKAWLAIIDTELELKVDDDSRFTVTGDNKDQLNQILPYWLCLDEMNLAPVEQYFADYLSILETREWQWHDDGSFNYYCDPILKAATIEQLADKRKLRDALGFKDEKYNDAWDLFCTYGLSLPFNLIVAGTVNMDETTHGFSRKVIDRALSFDFGDFFPNDFNHFFKSNVTHNALSYPIYSQANINELPLIDSNGSKSIEFLKEINKVLDNTPFQLAFRALNELLLAVISTEPKDAQQLQAVWDDFLMCKVLPRIEGDYDKLALMNEITSSNDQSLLTELATILKQNLADIWPTTNDMNKQRPDLYRKNSDNSTLYITCRSKTKLAWMQQRLERSGFTCFWP